MCNALILYIFTSLNIHFATNWLILSSEVPKIYWTVFHKTVHCSAATTLGHPSRKNQDWFNVKDDEIQGLHEEKQQLHKARQGDAR